MLLLVILLHSAYLWLLEFFLYPELVVYPYLISSGFLPYKDVLDQHFPGLMHLPVNFYTLGITSPLAFKLVLIGIVIIQSVLIFKILKNYFSQRIAIIGSVAYMLWQPFFEGNQLWLDIFLPLFTLPALWFFLKKKWWLTGLFIGLGVVFKQTLVPLSVFVGVLVILDDRKSWLQNGLRYAIWAVFPSCLMLLYMNHLQVLADFWYWTITFNLSGFASGGRLAPTLPEILKLTFPLALILGANLFSNAKKLTLLITGWMLFSIIGGVARFGFLHLQPALPYFAMLVALLVTRLWETNQRKLFWTIMLLTAVWVGFFVSRQKNLLTTKFYDPTTDYIVQQITERSDPGDKVFLLGVHPHIYALTETLPPGHTFIFQFPWFLEVAGERILQTLITDPPKVVVYATDSMTDGQYLRDYGSYLLKHVQDNFQLVAERDTVEVYVSP